MSSSTSGRGRIPVIPVVGFIVGVGLVIANIANMNAGIDAPTKDTGAVEQVVYPGKAYSEDGPLAEAIGGLRGMAEGGTGKGVAQGGAAGVKGLAEADQRPQGYPKSAAAVSKASVSSPTHILP